MKKFNKIISGITALTLCFSMSVNLAYAAEESGSSKPAEYKININDESGMFGGYDVYIWSDQAYFEGYSGGMSYFNLSEGASEEDAKKILGKYFDLENLKISSDKSKTYSIGHNEIIEDNRNEEASAQDACYELKKAGLISSYKYSPSERNFNSVTDGFDNYAPEEKEKLLKLSQEKDLAFEVKEVQESPVEAPESYKSYCHVSTGSQPASLYEKIRLAQKIYSAAGIRPLLPFSLTDAAGRTKEQVDLFSNSAPSIQNILFGDVNGDKIIDINDMTKLSLFLLGDTDMAADQKAPADANLDGSVNLADLATMKQYLMKDKITLGFKREYNNDIVLARVYDNYGWKHQYYCSFWDKQGNEYYIDLSDNDYTKSFNEYLLSDGEIMNKAERVYRTSWCGDSKPFTEDEMSNFTSLINKIDTEARFSSEVNALDAGESKLYGVKYNGDGSSEFVEIVEGGGLKRIPDDENAYKVFKLFTDKISNHFFCFDSTKE